MGNSNDTILLNDYKNIPTGNISDAMDELGLTRSVIRGIPSLGEMTASVAGYAMTIKQARKNATSGEGNLSKQGTVIESKTEEGTIVVIDTCGVKDVSITGAIQMMIAKSKGAYGYLTNGSIRDVDEIRKMDFPVFSASFSPLKSTVDMETIGVNVPVMIENVQIKPGDLLVMDATGIVVVPPVQAEKVLKKAKGIQQREKKLIEYLKCGMSLVDARTLAKKAELQYENEMNAYIKDREI